jgi:hypothetical protein
MTIQDVEFVEKHIVRQPYLIEDLFGRPQNPWKKSLCPLSSARACYELIAEKCESRLEIAWLLGAFIEHRDANEDADFLVVSTPMGTGFLLEDVQGFSDFGRGGVVIVPQWKSPERSIRHDFLIWLYGRGYSIAISNGWMELPHDHSDFGDWFFAVDLDGYNVHIDRRMEDARRIEGLSYPVYRVSELSSRHDSWFHQAINDVGEKRYEWGPYNDQDGWPGYRRQPSMSAKKPKWKRPRRVEINHIAKPGEFQDPCPVEQVGEGLAVPCYVPYIDPNTGRVVWVIRQETEAAP